MSQLTTQKRNRLLLKITGWPRISFLNEVFDNAKFIHVIRDGRAVVNSLMNVEFWLGWEGPKKWRWGPLSVAHQEEWNHYNQSFIVLAAIQWKMLMDAAEKAKKNIDKSNIMEIKYEELCASPIQLFRSVAEFCGLEWSNRFEKELEKHRLKNTNSKFEQYFNLAQQSELNDVLNNHLKKYGY